MSLPRPMTRPTVLLVSLGGTITMTRSKGGGITPTLTASDLVRAAPGIDAAATIQTISPMREPSASLTLDDVIELSRLLEERLSGGVDGAVVIQGTDTIEETAFVLDCLVASPKPLVVTGAMRGAEAAGADGPANVLAATIVAASPQASERGALVVLNDEIHAARFVQKAHTALPSAFRSPLLGSVGLVAEGTAAFYTRTERVPGLEARFPGVDAPVALVTLGLGEDGRLLSALPSLGYKGVVIEGMGAGHVPASIAPIVSELVAQVPVILASRVETGPVFSRTYGFPGSEIDLLRRGAIRAGSLSGLKARLLLMLLLRVGRDRDGIARVFASFV